MHEGIAQNWGWACSVRTPSAIGLNDDVIVDLDNIDTKSLIEIYPNPVDDNSNFVIQLTDENSENYKLYLLNMSGQVIQDFELSEENRAIETKITAPPGVYFLKVFKGDVFVETRKVIKT
jgi:hypothetical protein